MVTVFYSPYTSLLHILSHTLGSRFKVLFPENVTEYSVMQLDNWRHQPAALLNQLMCVRYKALCDQLMLTTQYT